MATNEIVETTPYVELKGITLMEFPDDEDIINRNMAIGDKGLKKLPIQKFIERVKELNLPYFIIEISAIMIYNNKKFKYELNINTIPDEYQKLRGLYVIKECKKNFIICDLYPFDIDKSEYLKKIDTVEFSGIRTIRFNSDKCEKNIIFKPSCIKEIKKNKNLYVNYYVAIDKFKMYVVNPNGYIGRDFYRFNSNIFRNIMYDKIPLDVDIKILTRMANEPLEIITPIITMYFDLLKIMNTNNEFYNKVMKNDNLDISLLFMTIHCGGERNGFLKCNTYNDKRIIEYYVNYNNHKEKMFNVLFKMRTMGIDTFIFLDLMIELMGYNREENNTVGTFVLIIINEYKTLIDTYHNKILKLITNDILVR